MRLIDILMNVYLRKTTLYNFNVMYLLMFPFAFLENFHSAKLD